MGQQDLEMGAGPGIPSNLPRAGGSLGGTVGLSNGGRPAPAVTSSWWCCCSRTWSTESASDSAALRVLSSSSLPSCSSRSLCPLPPAARFLGAGTGCPMATAPRRGARYTPLPREVREARPPARACSGVGRLGRNGALTLKQAPLQVVAFGVGKCLQSKPSSLKPQSDARRR